MSADPIAAIARLRAARDSDPGPAQPLPGMTPQERERTVERRAIWLALNALTGNGGDPEDRVAIARGLEAARRIEGRRGGV
jgi:hypothetical protein